MTKQVTLKERRRMMSEGLIGDFIESFKKTQVASPIINAITDKRSRERYSKLCISLLEKVKAAETTKDDTKIRNAYVQVISFYATTASLCDLGSNVKAQLGANNFAGYIYVDAKLPTQYSDSDDPEKDAKLAIKKFIDMSQKNGVVETTQDPNCPEAIRKMIAAPVKKVHGLMSQGATQKPTVGGETKVPSLSIVEPNELAGIMTDMTFLCETDVLEKVSSTCKQAVKAVMEFPIFQQKVQPKDERAGKVAAAAKEEKGTPPTAKEVAKELKVDQATVNRVVQTITSFIMGEKGTGTKITQKDFPKLAGLIIQTLKT